MTTLSELQVLLPELGENQLKLLRQWISDGIDTLLTQAQQYNEYDPETLSDDPVEAVPVAAVEQFRNKLGIV